MKKHKIKRIVTNIRTYKKRAEEVEAEIYEYKGMQFGLCWDDRPEKSINAIELQTGYSIATVLRREAKSPKEVLLQRIAHFVDKTNYEAIISYVRGRFEQRTDEINTQIRELEQERECLVFPINERIEL